MRKTFCILLVLLGSLGGAKSLHAQSVAVTRLVLDVQKLRQLKTILKDMQTGYTVLSRGYRVIRNVSEGNFHLHDLFLSRLLQVNPQLQQYVRVADIIAAGKDLVRGCQAAQRQIKKHDPLSGSEIRQLSAVYDQLLKGCLQNLNTLMMVLTDGTLRMDDAQRLTFIDNLYRDMQDQLHFLGTVNRQAAGWLQTRQRALQSTRDLETLFHLQP